MSVLLAASPAVAHEGIHITPHGAEWMPVLMGLGVIAVAGGIGLLTKVRARK
tara:strand:- start:2193 stop:2348 length:156 start_codon:yes stop_codon:yes gene_type:complete